MGPHPRGTVKKLDTDAGRVSIAHGEIENLDMPAMTMFFRIGEGVDASKLDEGADIEFTADRVNGELTVTAVK